MTFADWKGADMKEFILILVLSVIVNFVANLIFYTQYGNIIDWTISVLSTLSAVGIVETFKKKGW